MPFKIGDKVKIIDEKAEGVICNINEKLKLAIVCVNDFEFQYAFQDLIKVLDNNEIVGFHQKTILQNQPIITKAIKSQKKNNPLQKKVRVIDQNTIEIDLHAHQLFENEATIEKSLILKKQMEIFKEVLEVLKSSKYKKLIVIHGVGKKVLKDNIRDYILEEDYFLVEDAPMHKYGVGASIVQIA